MKTLKTTLFFLILSFASFTVKAQDASLNIAFNKIIDNYLALKDALATNEGNAAKAKAQNLLAALNSLPKQAMNSDQYEFYAQYEPKLQFDSRHISEVNMVAHQREHFTSLSNNLYAVLKKLKVNKETLYRQYCKVEKRYFITENEKAKDPYMGMTNCFKTIEILPAEQK